VKRRDLLVAVPEVLELESPPRELGEVVEGGEGNRGDMRWLYASPVCTTSLEGKLLLWSVRLCGILMLSVGVSR
jgi:hypothetical protein